MSDLDPRKRIALVGGRILSPSGELIRATLVLGNGLVIGFLGPGEEIASDIETLDVSGCLVSPGFIDSHVHGAMGYNFMAGNDKAVASISKYMAASGVTACVATTTSASLQELERTLAFFDGRIRAPTVGQVHILGVHLEGPYINPEYRGSHQEKYIRQPTTVELETLLGNTEAAVKVVTLAPEIPGGMAAVRWLADRGIQVSMGHTGATYQQALAAITHGVRRGTHLFNAMPPIHHRNPGPCMALLEDPNIFLELIADGFHVHPAVLKMAYQLAGSGRILLVTDGADVAGQGNGVFTRWEGTRVRIHEGKCMSLTGSLAGSTLTMDRAVRNMVNLAGVSTVAALRMATENPAKALGVEDRKGSLAPGKDADVVVLNGDLVPVLTIGRGKVLYNGLSSNGR